MMFQGEQQERAKGKRTSGFQNQPTGFSLGWEVSENKNQFQLKKDQKNLNMATKVTRQIQSTQSLEPMTFEDKCKQIITENPDITSDELQERMALWEANLNTVPQKTQYQPTDIRYEKRKPAQEAKNVIYGGQNHPTRSQAQNRSSRRNEGTLSLGDGYNYFKDPSNK